MKFPIGTRVRIAEGEEANSLLEAVSISSSYAGRSATVDSDAGVCDGFQCTTLIIDPAGDETRAMRYYVPDSILELDGSPKPDESAQEFATVTAQLSHHLSRSKLSRQGLLENAAELWNSSKTKSVKERALPPDVAAALLAQSIQVRGLIPLAQLEVFDRIITDVQQKWKEATEPPAHAVKLIQSITREIM